MIPERKIVAIREADGAGHTHIERVRLDDGRELDAEQVIAAIDQHMGHYVMPMPGAPRDVLPVRVRVCPDCTERVLWV